MLITKSAKYRNTLKVSHADSFGLKVLGKIELHPKQPVKTFNIFIGACKTLVIRGIETVTASNIEAAYRYAIHQYKLKSNAFILISRVKS